MGKEERENPRRARQLLSQALTAIGWYIRRQVIDSASIMRIAPRYVGIRSETDSRVLTSGEVAQI